MTRRTGSFLELGQGMRPSGRWRPENMQQERGRAQPRVLECRWTAQAVSRPFRGLAWGGCHVLHESNQMMCYTSPPKLVGLMVLALIMIAASWFCTTIHV